MTGDWPETEEAPPPSPPLAFAAATTRAEALARAAGVFRAHGLEAPSREARHALCAACAIQPAALIAEPDAPLGADAPRFAEVVERRAVGEPLSRILGRRAFWTLDLRLTPDVLDPRPETETVVEAALTLYAERRRDLLRFLDLGVGSGAILAAMLVEFPKAQGLGVDASAAAAAVACENLAACGLGDRGRIVVGDWTSGLAGPFDAIVGNPPYVRSADIAALPRAVRDFDPRLALDGGPDGLDAYRRIAPASVDLLAPAGWLILEVGAGQAEDALAILTGSGFVETKAFADLAGLARVVAGRTAHG